MKYFFDTEFIEDGRTIDLISIGIVAEDGAELYLCNEECDLSRANDWVRQNVLPHLPARPGHHWVPRKTIAGRVREFCSERFGRPEIWAYYADYDWVALCQLYGTMMDLPQHFPKFCMDLKQLSVDVGSPRHPEHHGGEHDALIDAKWNRELYRFLMEHRDKSRLPNS